MAGRIKSKVFDNRAAAANELSRPVDIAGFTRVALFATTSAATTVQFCFSEDGVTYYPAAPVTASGTGHYLFAETSARYVTIRPTAAVTITAWIAATE